MSIAELIAAELRFAQRYEKLAMEKRLSA